MVEKTVDRIVLQKMSPESPKQMKQYRNLKSKMKTKPSSFSRSPI